MSWWTMAKGGVVELEWRVNPRAQTFGFTLEEK